MDPITIGIAAALLGGIALIEHKPESGSTPSDRLKSDIEREVLERLKNASKITIPALDKWAKIEYNGDSWLVTPTYIAPVGIGEAAQIAKANNAELPTVGMVDAIWKAADLKIAPHPRGQYDKPASDFTLKTMNSPETHIAQLAYIAKQIDDSGNHDFRLLAGSHKDIVITKDGHLGIYGWHKLDGKPIQGGPGVAFTGHGADWKDYSQGLRLVRKVQRVA